jgi:hypothetical protein
MQKTGSGSKQGKKAGLGLFFEQTNILAQKALAQKPRLPIMRPH